MTGQSAIVTTHTAWCVRCGDHIESGLNQTKAQIIAEIKGYGWVFLPPEGWVCGSCRITNE